MNLESILDQENSFFLIAGPCIVEEEEVVFSIASELKKNCEKLAIPFIFKASFKKANRSRLDSFTGIGDQEALRILRKVRENLDVPVLTDIHEVSDAALASKYVDVLQIPALLARQTDLLVAASKTGKPVNIKKGQFMSPESMIFAVNKVKQSGNDQVFVTDRGTMFGYGDLIVDYRGIKTMQSFAPTVLDITHSLQQPNQASGISGGRPEMIETIARAGVAVGVNGIFMETHPTPKIAKSDGANMLPLDQVPFLLKKLVTIHKSIVEFDR